MRPRASPARHATRRRTDLDCSGLGRWQRDHGYRITPFIGANAQTPVNTGSPATGFTVTGLTNGTAYTFTVAATNARRHRPALRRRRLPVTPAVPPANPIVLENQNPGTTSWQLTVDHKALNQEIEGYASKTSVNKGSPIDFMVSLRRARAVHDGHLPDGLVPDGDEPGRLLVRAVVRRPPDAPRRAR